MNIMDGFAQEMNRKKALVQDGYRIMGAFQGLISRLNDAGVDAGMELSAGTERGSTTLNGRIRIPAFESDAVERVVSPTTGALISNPSAEYKVIIDFHPTTPRMSIERTDAPGMMYECFDLRADHPEVPTAEIVRAFSEYSENVDAKVGQSVPAFISHAQQEVQQPTW